MESQEEFLKKEQIEEEVLSQLHQGNFQFAEKLINIFQLDSFKKEERQFSYRKDKIEIEFYFNGTKEWWKNGERHRDGDKPAVVCADGTKEWLKNGKRHRDNDKPAVVYANGTKYWFKNGERHRDGDKPAIVEVDGSKSWWKNGKLHRDGEKPAVVYADGRKEWWVNGKFIRREKNK